ncbi:MAG: aspartyl protease family protein [Acidobacteria bacterium]|nr:aspartyl protease family protein [Acidobacteriota bacterium]
MKHSLKSTLLLSGLVTVLLTLVQFPAEQPSALAETPGRASTRSVTRAIPFPAPVEFREDDSRGLQIKTWVNDRGPFIFLIDTGAGLTLISRSVAGQARVQATGKTLVLQGPGNSGPMRTEEAILQRLAIGGIDNPLPNRGRVAVTTSLPTGIDGILDPTEAFQPLGFVLDFPNRRISALDPVSDTLRNRQPPVEGAIVRWVSDPQGRRPFVQLNGKVTALLDTGGRFGLAVSSTAANRLGITVTPGRKTSTLNDINGGSFVVHRIQPATIWLDSMVLERIPTDLLENVPGDTPVLFGRDALRPFRVSFDPRSRLIEFAPAAEIED